MRKEALRLCLCTAMFVAALFAADLRTADAQVVCNVLGQQGGSFISTGTGVPFTVGSTGRDNCRGLKRVDSTALIGS